MQLIALFIEYFKIGLFAIGGGMATIPFLSKLAERTHWFTQNDLLDMIAVSESTPGPIGVNTATYVGFHIDGIVGMLTATIGLVTPSVIVIIMVYSALKKFGDNFYVKSGMYGLRAASCGLIAAAGILVARVTLLNEEIWHTTHEIAGSILWPRLLLAIILLVLTTKFKKVHPVAWLAVGAVVGILFHFGS
jgi:chromate transporter